MRAVYLSVIFAGLTTIGCQENPATPSQSIEVSIERIYPISSGHYEAWLSFPKSVVKNNSTRVQHDDGEFVSIGKFVVDSFGAMKSLSGAPMTFSVPQGFNLQLAADAVISYEPANDTSSAPYAIFLGGNLTGDVKTGRASLTADHIDALDRIARTPAGSIFLDAPTTPDYRNGVWFGNWQTPPQPSLNLSVLTTSRPAWIYEAVLTSNATASRTGLGTFTNPATADSDSAGNGKMGYAFPGQDFPNTNLASGEYDVMIYIKPKASADFSLRLLYASIPATAQQKETIPLTSLVAVMPAATLIIQK